MKFPHRTMILVVFTTLLLRAQEGVLDPSFNGTGKVLTEIGAANDAVDVVVQSDGKIVVGGTASIGGITYFTAARYTSVGVLDASYGTDGIATVTVGVSGARVVSMLLQPDGKILLGGTAVPSGGSYTGFAVARLTDTGQPDVTFGVNGSAIVIAGEGDDPKGMALAPDGKIVLSGTTSESYYHSMVLIRFTSVGALDGTFNSGGIWLNSWFSIMDGYTTAVQLDGKIVIVGKDPDGGNCIIFRLNTDGSSDNGFGDPDWGCGVIYETGGMFHPGNIILQPDGKILFCGDSGDDYLIVERLNANGTYDNSFGVNGITKVHKAIWPMYATDIALQTDGDIVVSFTNHNYSEGFEAGVARFTTDGTVDTDFGTSGIAMTSFGTGNSISNCVATYTDDKIIIAGTLQDASRNTFALARFIGNTGTALRYNMSGFQESVHNIGSMSSTSPMTVVLRHDTLTGALGDDFITAGKVVVTNVPSGLTPVVTKTSTAMLSVQLTGAADVHSPADNVSNISIAFQNSAFARHTADQVNNAVRTDLGITFLAAMPRTALRFDGTDDCVQVPEDIWFKGDCTVEAWVYPRSKHSWNRLIDFGNGTPSDNVLIALSTGTSGAVSFHVFNGTDSKFVTAPLPLPLYSWSHIACVLTANVATIYINGTAVVSGTVYIPRNIKRTTNYIGKSFWYADGYVDATISEVRIWDVSRTQQQIRENMNHRIMPTTERLIGYWPLNDSIGSVASDAHGRNGTLKNFSMNAGSGWVPSDISSGPGRSRSAAAVTSGEFSAGGLWFSMTDDFDNVVDLTVTEVSATPFGLPAASYPVIGEKYYIVNTFGTPGTFAADLTIHFGEDQLDARVDTHPEGVKLFMRNVPADAVWTEIGGAVLAERATGNVTWSGISSLGQFAAVYEESALPVELASFTAKTKGTSIELAWKTVTEKSNYGFEIQRSEVRDQRSDSHEWKNIGFTKGCGTTNTPKEYSFTDKNLQCGKYSYRLKQIDRDGKYSYSNIVEASIAEVKQFGLEQNYPNPFNPVTTINYQLPENSFVTLKVYDAVGREVTTLVNEARETGKYSVRFDGSSLSSGVYFYTLRAGTFSATKKFLLTK